MHAAGLKSRQKSRFSRRYVRYACTMSAHENGWKNEPRQINVLLFGASGMVGTAALRECLADAHVAKVTTVGRSAPALQNAKLEHIEHTDFSGYESIAPALRGCDACFFCLGLSAAGLSEAAYARVTYDFTLAAATTLADLNPRMTFVYVSGAGTDSSGSGRIMWARVKGRTENALLALPFAAYMLRPGIIQPLNGIRSKTKSYRLFYASFALLLPLLRILLPNHVLTTSQIGRAMLNLAQRGYPKSILETRDIRIAAGI